MNYEFTPWTGMNVKLSDYVVQALEHAGAKHVFMLPGGGAMHLNDSLGRAKSLRYVSMLHEQAAAIAAEAYARVSGRIGVAMFTAGPGGTNAVTGVAAAYLDSTPCVFISGQAKRADLAFGTQMRQLGVQEIDIVSIVKPITKYAVTVMDPSDIRYCMERALYESRAGRPGPVWLDLPLDVQASDIDPDSLRRFDIPEIPLPSLRKYVDQVLAEIALAKRPILLLGNGIRCAGAEARVAALIEMLDIPVLTTRLGVDLIDGSNPLLIGMPGGIASRGANFALQNCDCLIAIGARLDMALIAYAPARLARGARKVMVNIDPYEIEKLREIIDVPIVADAGAFIDALTARSAEPSLPDISNWRERCTGWKIKYPFVSDEQKAAHGPVSVYAFSDLLSDRLSADDIVLPGSSGFACEIFLTAFKYKAGQRVFHNKGTGAMGLAQPAAIGACLAGDLRRTICVDGDGGFQMNIQELETVRRLGLPIKFFVIDNAGYASIRASQSGYFQLLTGADASSGMTLPDVERVASAFGIQTVSITNTLDMAAVIDDVLNRDGPVVCRVVTLPDEPRMPRVASIKKPDGGMVSKPLEDMWPFLPRDEFLENMLVPVIEE